MSNDHASDSPARITIPVAEALAIVQEWHDCELDCCKDSPACALAAEVERLRKIEAAARDLATSGVSRERLCELLGI